ncbi:hypothetical protein MPLSOD_260068 [Mesorhizobium sp. SOD10]|nr:hypothetical protein MPLSOD_260068 [Mesorhizobium sp. SOD10]
MVLPWDCARPIVSLCRSAQSSHRCELIPRFLRRLDFADFGLVASSGLINDSHLLVREMSKTKSAWAHDADEGCQFGAGRYWRAVQRGMT